jgi:hypothetical protein
MNWKKFSAYIQINMLFLPCPAFTTCLYPWRLSLIHLQVVNVAVLCDAPRPPALGFSPVSYAMHLPSSGSLTT